MMEFTHFENLLIEICELPPIIVQFLGFLDFFAYY